MPNVQHIDRQVRVAAEREAVISGAAASPGSGLGEHFPEVVENDATSRLGRLLARLSEASDAAEAQGQVAAGFGRDLIAAVPHLRRCVHALAEDTVAGEDLVRLTLLKAWTQRVRFLPGTDMMAWLLAILRDGSVKHPPAALGRTSVHAAEWSDKVRMNRRFP